MLEWLTFDDAVLYILFVPWANSEWTGFAHRHCSQGTWAELTEKEKILACDCCESELNWQAMASVKRKAWNKPEVI